MVRSTDSDHHVGEETCMGPATVSSSPLAPPGYSLAVLHRVHPQGSCTQIWEKGYLAVGINS